MRPLDIRKRFTKEGLRRLSRCEVRFEVATSQKRHDEAFVLRVHSEIFCARRSRLLVLSQRNMVTPVPEKRPMDTMERRARGRNVDPAGIRNHVSFRVFTSGPSVKFLKLLHIQ
jgi:hypothetical protein